MRVPIFRRVVDVAGTGFLCGLMGIAIALGNGALLARGDLLSLLTPIAGTMLIAAAVLPIATAWLSTIPGQVTTTQEISVVALAAVTGATAAAFSGGTMSLLATILVVVGLTTALCGIAMLALAAFRLGRITRYVPYPVFAGFLAITGWYLITGGLETVIGGHLDIGRLAELTEPGTALKLGAVACFIACVEILNRRFPSGAGLPVTVLLAVIVFNGVVFCLGIPRSTLEEAGWLIAVPSGGLQWPPIGVPELLAVDWSAVAAGLALAPFVIVITAAGAMMNVSGIELDTRREIDLNAELRSIGAGNVAAGFVGGIPGFPAVSSTLLAVRLGAPYRVTGLIAGLVALAALAFAPIVLGIVPLTLLGALLIWVGISLTADWLVRPVRTLRRSEYAIIVIILAVSIGAGLPAGIGAGLIAALLLFVIEYARVDGVRFVASGRDYHSRSISEDRRAQMARSGDAVAVFKLVGFLFFGTADAIVRRVAAGAARRDGPWFAMLDFRRVTGLDSSTALSFERLRRLAERDRFHIVFTELGPLAQRLADSGVDLRSGPFHCEPDLEAALRWVEDQILGTPPVDTRTADPGEVSLAELLGSEALAEAMMPYLEPVAYGAGERLIEQGTSADDIYFIRAGMGSVILESGHGHPVGLMEFGPGKIIGEMAFYGTQPRSASAVAETPGLAWKLSRAALEQIERNEPLTAISFHRALAALLSVRLQSANRLIRVLAD